MNQEMTVPKWWRAWQFLAPRWEMAADGQYHLEPDLFNKLQTEGFDTEQLRDWHPSDKDGRRIKLANRLVQLALNEPLDNLPLRKEHIAQQLAGDKIWSNLRQLAEAYLDGKRLLAPINKAPERVNLPSVNSQSVHPSTKTSRKLLFPSQIRKIENRQLLTELSQRTALRPIQTSIDNFLNGVTELTLYLDEAWFVAESTALRSNEGVIAGLLCQGGPETKIRKLPRLETHSFLKPLTARDALEHLWQCRDVLPLIFHLRLPTREPANPHYDALLQHTVRFLLGWLLPHPENPVKVHIFPEAIAPAHPEGDQAAEFYRGLLASDATGRFARWHLAELRWEHKKFGYIPYADLLAHLTLEHTEVNRALGAWTNFKQLPGYIPFSLELVPRLERLEHLETSANLGDVIDFALETGSSPFGRLVLQNIAQRLANRPDLQQRMLETLEERYRDKIRNLRQLRRAFAAVRNLLPALPETANPRMRLLWYLLALQDANHDGDPARIRATAGDYLHERQTLKQNERELCADADLNLAVHYADHFAFGHAEVTVGEWINDPLFPALSLRQQGRLYSALGQYRAMQGDAQGADRFFLKALVLFDQASLTDDERAAECDQTRIYLAINALDGGLPGALEHAETVLGPLADAARTLASDGSVKNQYRHHLLLRALFQGDEAVAAARTAYLDQRAQWQDGAPQHPWPLIHLYRGLLLCSQEEADDETLAAAQSWFDRAILITTMETHGATVKLIGAMIATAAACCFDDNSYVDNARKLLDAARILPSAQWIIDELTDLLNRPDPSAIDAALTTLPFNYH